MKLSTDEISEMKETLAKNKVMIAELFSLGYGPWLAWKIQRLEAENLDIDKALAENVS